MALMAGGVSAQSEIQQAFQQGKAELLSPYLSNEIELCIGNKEQTLAKAKAIQDIQTFFSSSPVKSFKAMHSGGAEDQSTSYYIGNLTTEKGEYRVYVYYKKPGGKLLIQEIRIE